MQGCLNLDTEEFIYIDSTWKKLELRSEHRLQNLHVSSGKRTFWTIAQWDHELGRARWEYCLIRYVGNCRGSKHTMASLAA